MSNPSESAARAPEAEPCDICGHTAGQRIVHAREMMFGLRDEFRYAECGGCGRVRLIDVPAETARYYPPEYFPEPPARVHSRLRAWLERKRAAYCLHGTGLVGRLLVRRYGEPRSPIFGEPRHYGWLRACGARFSTRIADVGCGSGLLLRALRQEGFTDLTGIDPYAPPSLADAPGLRFLRTELFAVRERFGLVMLHHTFEHLAEPLAVLRHLHALLEPGGHLIIRIPVASSHAWRHYGRDWAQLDAPRHLYLHTEKSMRRLAQDGGFAVASVTHDSTDFQFWASEQYRRDIPLKSPQSHAVDRATALFSADDLARYRREAEELNRRGEGDSACFHFRRP